ncbi:MAG TPA: ethylbenzene dehydrogenase-related protein [Candidatus Limnocylindria bacterium]|nr:ethylbenzene dehydrogenase-related protein [Candidatus Limnocylindria bacterium]
MRARRHAVGIAILLAACGGSSPPPPATDVTAVYRAALVEEPSAAAWAEVPELRAPLLLQDMVEPRLLTASTPEVRVRAMTDGRQVAFRLEWPDVTRDDLPGTGRFSDACAVQLPAATTPDVPAPQMGEPGRPVEISYWRAFWQAVVDGRPDTINALYPGAAIDHYPFEATPLVPGSPAQQAMARRYAPARALGNAMAGPRASAVQDLIGEGPSTLRPASEQRSRGRGVHSDGGWAAVIVRPLPAGMRPDAPGQVAFAVWDGSGEEAGARKMRTAWIPFAVEGGR